MKAVIQCFCLSLPNAKALLIKRSSVVKIGVLHSCSFELTYLFFLLELQTFQTLILECP